MKFRCLLILLLFIATITCSQNKGKQSNIDIQKVEEDFESLLSNIKNYYPYLNEEIVDFNCIKTYYSKQIHNLKTFQEVTLFFEFVTMEFYDNHFSLSTNNNQSYRLFAPIYLSIVNDKIFIENVWVSNIKNLETNILKAEVLSFNGVDFSKEIENFPLQCADKSNLKVRNWIANKIIYGTYNKPRILQLKLTDNSTYILDLDKIILKKTKALLSAKIIDNIGLITINNSLGDNKLISAFDKVLDSLSTTKAIILDLRNTVSGGNTYVAKGIMSRFVNQEKPYQKHSLFESYNNQPKIKRSFVEYVTPRGKQYLKPLVVLVGRWTGSMGEGLTIGFDGLQRATIIGTEMQKLKGAIYTVPLKNFNFAYNMPAERLFHINGTSREDFIPKNYINQNNVDVDIFLEKALSFLKNQ
ncbi:S41 family peptidase [Polaribacter aestuariivivens]|uniref:S41 family peptidase n=1 Tax=Polaribacter aestuariivivens TaxID=2304626 RepID=UPI003F4925C3